MSAKTAFEVGRLFQPIKAIADVLTASQKDVFVRLPGLLAYWPMGIRFSSGAVVEHGGAGDALVQTGICSVGYDGNSFAHLGDGVNYLSASSAFGVTGLETYIDVSLRGLTIGGWFMIDSSPSILSGLISKDKPSPDRGYVLGWTTSEAPQFQVSGNGTSVSSVVGGGSTTGQWHFVVGRFIPSAEIAIFNDGDKSANVTAIPASVNVSTQAFEVGRTYNDNSRVIDGKARDVFVCAVALSDALIEETRAASVP